MNIVNNPGQPQKSLQDAATRRAVLVLGMHRSGTSAFTRVLSLLGADLPAALQPPDVGNELGFWEPAELVVIHDEMLAAAGSSWDDYRALPLEWSNGDAASEFRGRMLAVLRKDFANSSLFTLKDPRVCRFVPLWNRVLRDFQTEPSYAMVYRNPLEVAASLRARNQFGTTFSCLLWLRHVLDAERFSRGGKRAWVAFDAVLQDWRPAISKAATALGLELPRLNDPDAAAAIDAYLSPQQRHHRRTTAELNADPEVPAWANRVYEAIEREQDEPGAGMPVFDEVTERLEEMEVVLTQLGGGKQAFVIQVASLKHAAEMHRRESEALYQQNQVLKQQSESLQVQHQSTDQQLDALRQHCDGLRHQNESLQKQLDILNFDLTASHDRIADFQKTATKEALIEQQISNLGTKLSDIHFAEQLVLRLTAEKTAQDQEIQRQRELVRDRENQSIHFQRVAGIQNNRLERLRGELTRMRTDVRYFGQYSVSDWNVIVGGSDKSPKTRAAAERKAKEVIAASGLFDRGYYLATYPDIARSGVDPLEHYCKSGWRERRNPHSLFDAEFYLARNPDVSGVNPLAHYLILGAWENRDPNPLFSSRWYLTKYLDVAAAAVNPLSHYVLQGAAEGRWPNASFDPNGFLMSHMGESEAVTNPLKIELSSMKMLGQTLPAIAASHALSGRDRQFFDVFDFVIRNRPAALSPPPATLNLASLKISIVVPAFESGSGGIMTILRLVQQLEFAGHEVTLLVKPVLEERRGSQEFAELIQRSFLPVRARVQMLDEVPDDQVKGDALVATDRWTCYPVRSLKNFRRRFYLVQDYETQFYPTGAESLLTEDTYYFGFDAICAGPWLAELMASKFGMRAWSFELAADRRHYYQLPRTQRSRNRIAFYARIATARRAVELGYLAFEVLRQRGVDFHVDFFGTDIGAPKLGYSYANHGVMSAEQLGQLYNVASIGLVFSATNYSLIPREMMACGLPVIELDSESSRISFPDMTAELVRPDPIAIANVLQAMLADPVRRDAQSRRGLAFAAKFDWAESGRAVERALKEGLSQ